MQYISKGTAAESSTKELLYVTRGDYEYSLDELQTELWQNGRFSFSTVKNNLLEEKALYQLRQQQLVELAEDVPSGEYWALTQCVPVPTKTASWFSPLLNPYEKWMMYWLVHADLRLTMAELVYLMENCVQPTPELLGPEGRQSLTERIYTQETIFDNILESQMESAVCRDWAVKTLLSLLQKKRIVLL